MDQQLCVFSNVPPLKPTGSMITDDTERKIVLRRLEELYRIRSVRSFPGGQPVSIERKDLTMFKTKMFMVSLKTDGVRYLLLLMMMKNEPKAIMIDRRLEMHEIESVWAPQSYFEEDGGTLLDGELVWEHGSGNHLSQLFLVFDIVSARGGLTHLMFSERLTRIHKHVLSELPARMSPEDDNVETLLEDEDKIYLNAHSMRMAPKRFVSFQDACKLWEERTLCKWKNDGLIFMSNAPLQIGTDRSAYKWKPVNSITIDIVVNAERQVLVQERGQLVIIFTIKVFGETKNVFLQNSDLLDCIGPTTSVLECTCSVKEDSVTFKPIKCRNDKVLPNERFTVTKTLENVVEAVSFEEIFA